MYQALYRKWRPRDFDGVVGQDHITLTLKNEVASGKFSHAYLFTGSRGTGKPKSIIYSGGRKNFSVSGQFAGFFHRPLQKCETGFQRVCAKKKSATVPGPECAPIVGPT